MEHFAVVPLMPVDPCYKNVILFHTENLNENYKQHSYVSGKYVPVSLYLVDYLTCLSKATSSLI